MSRRTKDPSYRRHKQSGQAIVSLSDGTGGRRDVLLGRYGTPESRDEYNRILSEWKAAGRRPPAAVAAPDLTLNEVMVAYARFMETYYVKDAKPTSEQDTIRQALRFLKRLYGHTSAKDFGPLALKAVRAEMVSHPITRTVKKRDPETGEVTQEVKLLRTGLARRFINNQIERIRRMFAWAVEEELIPVTIYQALATVRGLRKGQAREKPRVKPVPEAYVAAVLPRVSAAVRTMIEVQRLSGSRPQDVVRMRAIDIDMTGPVWEYRPPGYKTEHHNDEDDPDRARVIFLGPRAQALLRPFLTLNVSDYLFSPKRSEKQRSSQRRQQRQTPLWPSHLQHQQRKKTRRPRPRLRDHYDVASYRRAIRRACLKANVPVWAPNQLRHSRGTEVRKRFGLEASQAVLGHANLGTTQVYAEVDRETARRVIGEIG